MKPVKNTEAAQHKCCGYLCSNKDNAKEAAMLCKASAMKTFNKGINLENVFSRRVYMLVNTQKVAIVTFLPQFTDINRMVVKIVPPPISWKCDINIAYRCGQAKERCCVFGLG